MNDAAVVQPQIGELTVALLRFSAEQLQALAALCLRLPDRSYLTPDSLQRELRLPTADAMSIIRAVQPTAAHCTLRDIAVAALVCAQAATLRGQNADKVDIVCTGPVQFAVPVRMTFATMVELVQEARSEIVIVGYVFTSGAGSFVREVTLAGC